MNIHRPLLIVLLSPLAACAPPPPEAASPPAETASPVVLTLRQAAEQTSFEIGTAIDGWQFDHSRWREVAAEQFNLAAVTWGINWSEFEPQPGAFDYSIADKQVAFALAGHMAVRAHPLVWGTDLSLIPEWLRQSSPTRGELAEAIRDHVTRVMTRYRGKIRQWVVTNEPYLEPVRTRDFFYSVMGYDYIELAFQAARAADPSAILIYNDSDNHNSYGQTARLTRTMVERLKAGGLIDGVGLQMHINGIFPVNKQDVIATMKSYGVPVYVTEFDVDIRDVRGAPAERYALQAEIYRDMLGACLESGVCRSFTVWGIGDRYSWREWPAANSFASPDADPTPFDDSLNPKPAYYAMLDTLLRGMSS